MRLRAVFLATVLGALAASPAWAGAPYYRFWQGWKQATIPANDFASAISQTFAPATVRFGQTHGMTAYLPFLAPLDRPAGLPDEVALVVYRSEESYLAAMATPEGKAYGASHWRYFDRSVSRSSVPVPYVGQVAVGAAYDLSAGSVNWQKGEAVLSVYLTDDPKDAPTIFSSLHAAVAVVGANYVLVYSDAPPVASSRLFGTYPLTRQQLGEIHFQPGGGISAQF